MSLRNDDAFDDAIESLPGAAPTVVNGNTWRSGSEEEIDTGEVRMYVEWLHRPPPPPTHTCTCTREPNSHTHTHTHVHVNSTPPPHTHTLTHTICRSGRLVFSEDSAEDNSATPSQVSLDGSSVAMETEEEYRGRSWSNSSEQRGRFEVCHINLMGMRSLCLDKDDLKVNF